MVEQLHVSMAMHGTGAFTNAFPSDNQALSRFHRMGQKKPSVHFVRIVVTKTVDSKIINCKIHAFLNPKCGLLIYKNSAGG